MTPIDESDKKAIIQIYRSNSDRIVGTGFWLGGCYLITCAHVVTSALAGKSYSDPVGQEVRLMFDEADIPDVFQATVVYWRYHQKTGKDDVAILKLQTQPDLAFQGLWLDISFREYSQAQFSIYGYAGGDSLGRNIYTTAKGRTKAWLEVEADGFPVIEGVSGAPVWYNDDRTFVGIVVARDIQAPEAKRAFIIPAEELSQVLAWVQGAMLLDILEPVQQRLASVLKAVYGLCLNQNWLDPPVQELRPIIQDLVDRGAGFLDSSEGDNPQREDKLVQFVAALLNRPETLQIEGLSPALTAWGQRYAKNLDAAMGRMRRLALEQQYSVIQPSHPMLLVSIETHEGEASDKLYVTAWLMPDPEQYKADKCQGLQVLSSKFKASEHESKSADQGIRLSELPLLINTYLRQVRDYSIQPEDLTVEMFLPSSLINQPIECLMLPACGMKAPLGIGEHTPQVIVRSQYRLQTDYFQALTNWEDKWRESEQQSQTLAQDVFVEGNSIMAPEALGLKQYESLLTGEQGEISLLTFTGVALALWVRTNPVQQDWRQLLNNQILDGSLAEVPDKVLKLRRQAQRLPNEADYVKSPELGHCVSLLWESPKRVPPKFLYTNSAL